MALSVSYYCSNFVQKLYATLQEEEIGKKLLDFRTDIFHRICHLLHTHSIMTAQAILQLLQLSSIKACFLRQAVDKINVSQADSELLQACSLQCFGCQHDNLGIGSSAAGTQHFYTGLLKFALPSCLNFFITVKICQIAKTFDLFAALQARRCQAGNRCRHIIAQHQQIIAAVKKTEVPFGTGSAEGINIFKIGCFYLIIAPFVKNIDNRIFDSAACLHLSRQNILGSVGNLIYLISHLLSSPLL